MMEKIAVATGVEGLQLTATSIRVIARLTRIGQLCLMPIKTAVGGTTIGGLQLTMRQETAAGTGMERSQLSLTRIRLIVRRSTNIAGLQSITMQKKKWVKEWEDSSQ